MTHDDDESTGSDGASRKITSVFATSNDVLVQYLPPSLHRRTLQSIVRRTAQVSSHKLLVIRIGLLALCSATWMFALMFGEVLAATSATLGVPEGLIYAPLICTALFLTSALKTPRIFASFHFRNND